eukprot:a342796_22.p1 GENE.a342796_22~~a342796_22.p1  ORF type:complete len:300 (-),score=100.49 a342796_22:148-1011(-)
MDSTRLFSAVLVAGLVAGYGKRKRSLSNSGAVAGFATGFATLALGGYRAALVLIAFFISSSALTKHKKELKRKLEADFDVAAERTAIQVFANSLAASLACAAYYFSETAGEEFMLTALARGSVSRGAIVFVLAHYAACCGDTWASELGVLSRSPPRLVIAPWRTVPPGTNGGMSTVGTAASVAGGAFMGLTFFVGSCAVAHGRGVFLGAEALLSLGLGAFSGGVGSIIDSVLGATLQFSGWDEARGCVVSAPGQGVKRISGLEILDNHAVNWISALAMGGLAVAVFG